MRRALLSVLSVPLILGAAALAGASCSNDLTVCDGFCDGPPVLPESTVISKVRPPPLSGGTLFIAADGVTAIVADPDRDRILVANVGTGRLTSVVPTPIGAQPGRAAEDAKGRIHVVLREAGSIATIDPNAPLTNAVLTPVCPAPRGIAFAKDTQELYVACAGGELVRLRAEGELAVEATTMLATDLRDVVVSGPKLFVSHFRSAELDTVARDGTLLGTRTPPSIGEGTNVAFTPDVAWRIVARPGGGVVMMHQEAKSSEVVASPQSGGGYAGPSPCFGSVVESQVTEFDDNGNPIAPAVGAGGIGGAALPVDLAVSPDGGHFAVVAAGSNLVFDIDSFQLRQTAVCPNASSPVTATAAVRPSFVAAAYLPDGTMVVQTREPSSLELHDANGSVLKAIDLGGESRADSGYDVFHGNPDATDFHGVQIACASCHPEGGDDGHVWTFDIEGTRRTMSLAGNVMARAPFHWRGDLKDVSSLMNEVFVGRMGGQPQDPVRTFAIATYLATFPRAPSAGGLDAAAVARGKALFESADVACTNCHNGPQMTNNAIVDVGTGDTFKVPSLIGLGVRPPYLHSGTAVTLADRFGRTGGGDRHGHTSQLSADDVSDLAIYLASL